MKHAAFLFTTLFCLQVYGQNIKASAYAPGTLISSAETNPQEDPNEENSLSLQVNEIGVAFGQDFPSGDSANMYFEGRLGLSQGKNLWVLAYGLSNPWDFNIGGASNQGNTSILSGSFGQKFNLFEEIQTQAYLGISYLNQKTENGHNQFWGFPLTLIIDKPIVHSFSLGLIGQLQPTTKKGRALIGLKISYDPIQ